MFVELLDLALYVAMKASCINYYVRFTSHVIKKLIT